MMVCLAFAAYTLSSVCQVAINLPVAHVLDEDQAASASSASRAQASSQVTVQDFTVPRPGYASEFDNLVFYVGASYYEFSDKDDSSYEVGRAGTDEPGDSMDIYPESMDGTLDHGDDDVPNDNPNISFESVQGGGFLLKTAAQEVVLEYDDNSTSNVSCWVHLLFQDGAVRKDTYIKGETAAVVGDIRIEAWDPYGSNLVPISEAQLGDLDFFDVSSTRYLNLTSFEDGSLANYNNLSVANVIFAPDDDEDFGLNGECLTSDWLCTGYTK
eukprot:m.39707 g.39707  ORF g.39707 m.39707 type:complete len:270 (+) comp12693_c0_seq5:167-976(+)